MKQEDMIMNTNRKELTLVGVAAAAVKVADFIYDRVKGK